MRSEAGPVMAVSALVVVMYMVSVGVSENVRLSQSNDSSMHTLLAK